LVNDSALAVAGSLVVLINGLWYWGKAILRRRGYRVSWFGGHFGDLANLWRESCAVTDGADRAKLRMLLGAIVILLVALVVAFLVID
jgi:hypothetical protein